MKQVSCPACGGLHEATRSDCKCLSCIKKCKALKTAKYRLKHPEEVKSSIAAWRKKNPEKTAANKRNFQEKNRAHRCAYEKNREAMKLCRTPKWADLQSIDSMYEMCGLFRNIGLDLEVDHIIPLKGKTVSGLHVENNLQLLHSLENRSKKNRLFEDLLA